uniref:non-specific serine/threonine protein kinase n=1 Tax=Panagrolaimus superbus TaxID=310955 RepID=A0A914YG50_9BILA
MEKLKDYKLLKYLNQGAQGKCFLYEQTKDFLKQKVVIKQIPTECSDEQLQEAEILKKCAHPFVVGFYDCFLNDSKLFIVTHFSEGGSLGAEIRGRKEANPRQFFEEDLILQYFTQITMALDYLHSQNIIHRDLKPENILLNGSKKIAKLADFGISKIIENGEFFIKSEKMLVGTGYYIPPEIYNRQNYGKEVDIWALGCVLFEMFELERTFIGPSACIAIKVLKREYNQPSRISNSYLIDIFNDCLNLNAMNRPTTTQILRSPPILKTTAKILCMTCL